MTAWSDLHHCALRTYPVYMQNDYFFIIQRLYDPYPSVVNGQYGGSTTTCQLPQRQKSAPCPSPVGRTQHECTIRLHARLLQS
jgi:hypothetical protein